jgi:phosphate transport system substrate-binding protein
MNTHMKRWTLAVTGLLMVGASVATGQQINAAGATFPAVIYQKWFEEYHKLHPAVQVNYQSIGSTGGIQQLTSGTVDFGASDKPMSDDELKALKTPALHFPTVLGAVVATYNVPGLTRDLQLSSATLAGIYLGTVTKWNDKLIAADNPGAKLPGGEIVVVHRSDGSGTSFIFTDYLSKVSPEWKSKVGANGSVNWPVGLGGKGNEGVTGLVKQTPNSLGYVELAYAVQNKLPYASIKNADGVFVKPSFESVSACAAGATKEMPADFRVSITNAPGKGSYPISSFTWMLIPTKFSDATKGKEIAAFLKWMLVDGQKFAPGLYYAPLPQAVIAKEEKQIAMIK